MKQIIIITLLLTVAAFSFSQNSTPDNLDVRNTAKFRGVATFDTAVYLPGLKPETKVSQVLGILPATGNMYPVQLGALYKEIQDTLTKAASKGCLLGNSTVDAYLGQNTVAYYLLTSTDSLVGTTVKNDAVAGHTILQQQGVWLADADKALYDWIIVEIGLNDLEGVETIAAVLSRYQTLIDTINATKKDNAIVIGATMTPAKGRFTAPAQVKWGQLNLAIMGGGATPITGLNYRLNNHTAALNDGNDYLAPIYDMGDYIHPTNEARKIMAECYRSVLKQAGFLTGSSPAYFDNATIASKEGYISGSLRVDKKVNLVSTINDSSGVIFKNNIPWLHDYHNPTGGGAIPDGINIFIGPEAGNFTTGATATSTTHSSNLVGIGQRALNGNTTGHSNVAMSRYALNANTTGAHNIAIGAYAQSISTTAEKCVNIGGFASRYNTGTENTAVGYSALMGVNGSSTGTNNAAFGLNALIALTTGSYNVAVGYGAGTSLASGSQNVFIGALAGYYETGHKKLYISNTNTTWANSATNDGNLIYGDFDANFINIFNKVAIGVAKIPAYALDVAGEGYFSDDLWVNDTARFIGEGNILTSGNGNLNLSPNGAGKVIINSDMTYGLRHLKLTFSDSSRAVLITQNVYTKITNPGNNLWTNIEATNVTFAGDSLTVVTPGDYVLWFNLDATGAGTNDVYKYRAYKNGAAVAGGPTSKGVIAQAGWVWYFKSLQTGDNISIRVTNTVDNDDITVENGSIYFRKEHD